MNELNAAFQWMEGELKNIPYGELGLTITIHNKAVTRIQKTIVEKEQTTKRIQNESKTK